MTVLNAICTNCQTNFRVAKNGVTVFERLDSGMLYKIWGADKLECPGCNTIIVTRFANNPVHCLGVGTSELEAAAEALAANPECEIFNWYPTSRDHTTPQGVPVETVKLSVDVEDLE